MFSKCLITSGDNFCSSINKKESFNVITAIENTNGLYEISDPRILKSPKKNLKNIQIDYMQYRLVMLK